MVEQQLREPRRRGRARARRHGTRAAARLPPRGSPPAPTTTRRCRSAPARRSRSRTWSPASARQLSLHGDERVLDVGTGSGYQAAVLAELAGEVHTIERHPGARGAARGSSRQPVTTAACTSTSATARSGCPSRARSTRLRSPPRHPELPASLYEQLQPRGRLVVPVGKRHGQQLQVIDPKPEGPAIVRSVSCRFVPLLGEEGFAV